MVILIRHAEAVEETREVREPVRHLTIAGRDAARSLGERLAAQGLRPDLILTSPLVRALQSAELVAAGAGYHGSIEVLLDLVPGHDVRAAAAALRDRGTAGASCLFAIGHEPSISAVAALLCNRQSFHALAKGQACCIDGGQPLWQLGPGDAAPVPVPGSR